MAKIEQLAHQLKEVYSGAPWYGKPVRTILEEIVPEKACLRPDGDSHSVFQLARHMLAWRKYTLEKLSGNHAYKLAINSEDDWATSKTVSAAEWNSLLNDLDSNQQQLISALGQTPETSFDALVQDKPYSLRNLVEGVVQHEIYHGGQIVTTAKITGAYKPSP